VPASPPSSGVRVSAAVAPCTRDPRTRTDLPVDPRPHLPVDPRPQPTASFHQTAVVLPTQAKPSSTVTMQPDSATQVGPAASSGTAENIFDLLLKDLNRVKSESVADRGTVTHSAASGELKTDGSSALAVEPCASNNQPIIHEITDTIRKLVAIPKLATAKPDDVYTERKDKSEEMQLKTSSQPAVSHSVTTESMHSDVAYDVNYAQSSPPDEGRDRDRQSQHRGGTKSVRRRASSPDREDSKGAGQLTMDVRGKEKDAGPLVKRMRQERQHKEVTNIDSPESVPREFM